MAKELKKKSNFFKEIFMILQFKLCRRRDLNPQGSFPLGPEPSAFSNFATPTEIKIFYSLVIKSLISLPNLGCLEDK